MWKTNLCPGPCVLSERLKTSRTEEGKGNEQQQLENAFSVIFFPDKLQVPICRRKVFSADWKIPGEDLFTSEVPLA